MAKRYKPKTGALTKRFITRGGALMSDGDGTYYRDGEEIEGCDEYFEEIASSYFEHPDPTTIPNGASAK